MGKRIYCGNLSFKATEDDIRNLFVMDASGFPSGGCQNPTLTIMAMAVRSTDHLMSEFRKRNL